MRSVLQALFQDLSREYNKQYAKETLNKIIKLIK